MFEKYAPFAKNIRFVGELIGLIGIFIVAASALSTWVGDIAGFDTSGLKFFNTATFVGLMLIIVFAMICFWVADRLEKHSSAKPDGK